MAKVKSEYQGTGGAFYLVNPGGAIHTATKDHTRERLKIEGWRLAEDSEIEVYLETPVQRAGRPICEPWSPEPVVEAMELTEQGPPKPEATPSALAYAQQHNIDLAGIQGTGAGGRIVLKDVEALQE